MARVSNKFFNLVVLLLVVPAIIVALDADISANAAPVSRFCVLFNVFMSSCIT